MKDFTEQDIAAIYRVVALRRDMRHFLPDPLDEEAPGVVARGVLRAGVEGREVELARQACCIDWTVAIPAGHPRCSQGICSSAGPKT